MITEDYCSYEVAKLLKEKGFDEYCRYFYDCDTPNTSYLSNKRYGESIHNSKVYDGRNLAACPTHQMAMKWLREEKNIIINVWYNGVDWSSEYYNNKDENFYLITDYSCNSYEDAVEIALKYVLENLI